MKVIDWNGLDTYESARQYACGYCNLKVAANSGYGRKTIPDYDATEGKPKPPAILAQRIAVCPNCSKPTFWDGGQQVPGEPAGEDVKHLPPDIERLYGEARNCMKVWAYTAGAMACRKILMNVAVHQGARTNGTFKEYVDYLDNNGHFPASCKAWVTHIKDKGNEANHEIPQLTEDDLRTLLSFTQMLLTIIYDFPNRVP